MLTMKRLAHWASSLAVLGLLVLSPGCGGGGGGSTPAPVEAAPSITSQPADVEVNEGQTATLSVTASGGGTFSYQWKRGGVDIAGATGATYTTPALLPSDDGAQYAVAVRNNGGVTLSRTATIRVKAKPTITAQPASATVSEGQTATFSVTASGANPLSYQWRKNGTAITGANQASYTTPATVLADSGASFTVVVSNSAGSATSTAASLTVSAVVVAPTITTHPASQAATVGATVQLTVAASGTQPFNYQWYRNGSILGGPIGSTLSIPNVQTSDAGSYYVVVTNAAGNATSNVASLTVNEPVSFLSHPVDQTVVEGGSGGFAVTARGTGPLTYQWQKDGTNLVGQTSDMLRLSNIQTSDAGSYRVVVTGAAGSATSNAATLTVNVPVTINTHPADQVVAVGGGASFTVGATGTGPLTYQWYKDGVVLAGQTSATLTLLNVQAADAGSYRVIVTGASGSVMSNAGILTVNVPGPSITTQPSDRIVTAPDSPTFTVIASGTDLSYQWQKNGADIPGANAASYTVPGFTDLQTVPDTYRVVVTNSEGSVTSNAVTFTVGAPNPYYLLGGQPVPAVIRPLTVLPSLHQDPVKFPSGSFMFGYDETLKNPVWTAYADFKVNTPYANSTGDYQTDTRLAAPQVTKDSMGTHGGAGFYLTNGQGFDRGHMVTRSDVSYRYGPQAGDDATYMSNLIPQVSYFNQRIWNDLEEAVGGKTVSGGFNNGLTATFGRIWIYSGPVFTGTTQYWVPSTETYTTNPGALPAGTLAIAIPTACYKIVVAEPAAGQTLPRVMAWVSSNRSYATAESVDIWKYVTSLKRVEELTGLDFLPAITPSAELTALKAGVDVRGWGTSFEKASGPNVHILKPSWDLIPITTNPVLTGETVQAGTAVAFEGAASPNSAGGTVDPATCTWTFGDGSPTTTGLTTSHIYSAAGSYTVTFTATDSGSQSNSITRVITVVAPVGNAAPTVSPSTLPDVTMTLGGTAPNTTFTVSDDTTAAGSLVVTATSSNQTLLLDGSIAITNTNGNVSMTLTPNAGETGSATITVTVTDGDSASTVKTFAFSVNANNPPTFTPSTLPNVSTPQDTAKVVNFTVADDLTAAGLISVTATSDNQTLLPNTGGISVVNAAGSITLTLTPAVGQTGTVVVTVVATDGNSASTTKTFTLTVEPPATSGFTEGFESNAKGSYAAADVTLPSGVWNLNDAVIGNLANDKKNGSWSVRVRNTGIVSMQFDFATGAKTVTVLHAKYGTEVACTWQLWYSTDGGSNWTQAGVDQSSTPDTLTPVTFTINLNQPIRFQLRKTSGGTARINFDDFQIVGY